MTCRPTLFYKQSVVVILISNLVLWAGPASLVTAGTSSFPGPGRHLRWGWNQLPVINANRDRGRRMRGHVCGFEIHCVIFFLLIDFTNKAWFWLMLRILVYIPWTFSASCLGESQTPTSWSGEARVVKIFIPDNLLWGLWDIGCIFKIVFNSLCSFLGDDVFSPREPSVSLWCLVWEHLGM